jgi:hypothetical protein
VGKGKAMAKPIAEPVQRAAGHVLSSAVIIQLLGGWSATWGSLLIDTPSQNAWFVSNCDC